MAERANGMVQSANPPEMIADINEKAALGGELAERACRVDEGDETDADVDGMAMLGGEPAVEARGVGEGDETERGYPTRLQQTIFYCEERHQLNENTMDDIPIAYGLPLEGEWAVYSSDESDTLVIASIEPESTDSGEIPHVCLGGTRWRVCDVEGLGDRADGLSCETDGARRQTDASRASNRPEMAVVSHNEGAGTYLGAGGAKGDVEVTDGIEHHAHTSTGHGDVPGVETKAIIPANATQNVRIPRKKTKPPDLPVEAAICAPDKPDGCGNLPDTLSVHRDTRSVETGAETAAEEAENVRTRQTDEETRNSLNTRDNATYKRPVRWRKVSVGDSNVYVPRNAPVEALGTASRTIVFGQVETACEERVEAIAPGDVEGAGDGDGDRYGDHGDVGDTASGGSVHSKRVEATLLAGKSQYTCYSRRTR